MPRFKRKEEEKKSVPPTDNAVPASNYDPLLLRWSKEINVNHTYIKLKKKKKKKKKMKKVEIVIKEKRKMSNLV